MAYQILQNINLDADFTARDINIIKYNVDLTKLNVYLNALNSNVELHNTVLEAQSILYISFAGFPEEAEDGDSCILLT